ncbi:MAG TPA: TonB family protein [Vicinamibacterales bacterium]|nr:TonB family protein [Vicinamibacterales bacterium]
MRTWTLAVSICAHAAVVVAIFVAPIFATSDLPDPRRPLTFEAITPIATPAIAVTPSSPSPPPTKSIQPFPIDEPQELPVDDPPLIAVPTPQIDACNSCGVVGIPIGDGPAGHDLTPPPVTQAPNDPIPIGGNIRPPTRVVYVAPAYPQFALAARKEGTVILQAVIDETGNVREVKVLRSVQLLDGAALQAVANWKFTPTLLNGKAVPVVMTVTVAFALTK